MSANEITELRSTFAKLAASTTKIDQSIKRIASALEQTSNSRQSPLLNDEKDEEIALLKKYVKMREAQDASFEETLKQKDDSIEEMKAIILENQKVMEDKDKVIEEMEAAMTTMMKIEDHEALMEREQELSLGKDGVIGARGKMIGELNAKISEYKKALSTNGGLENLLQQKEDIIVARGKVICEQLERIKQLNEAVSTEGEKYWSDLLEKVLEEMEGVRHETGQFTKTTIKRATKQFLDIISSKASEHVHQLRLPSQVDDYSKVWPKLGSQRN